MIFNIKIPNIKIFPLIEFIFRDLSEAIIEVPIPKRGTRRIILAFSYIRGD